MGNVGEKVTLLEKRRKSHMKSPSMMLFNNVEASSLRCWTTGDDETTIIDETN